MPRADSLEKNLMLGKIEGRRRRGQQRMVRWPHRLNGHEFEQTPGEIEGQGDLECCSPRGHKELDTAEQLIPKKGNAKECSNYHTIELISHANKVILKIRQARLQ